MYISGCCLSQLGLYSITVAGLEIQLSNQCVCLYIPGPFSVGAKYFRYEGVNSTSLTRVFHWRRLEGSGRKKDG